MEPVPSDVRQEGTGHAGLLSHRVTHYFYCGLTDWAHPERGKSPVSDVDFSKFICQISHNGKTTKIRGENQSDFFLRGEALETATAKCLVLIRLIIPSHAPAPPLSSLLFFIVFIPLCHPVCCCVELRSKQSLPGGLHNKITSHAFPSVPGLLSYNNC